MGSEIFNFLDFDKKKLNLFLTQSGETIDIVEPLKKLTLKGLKTAALVNRSDSTVHRLATASQLIEAGPEIAVVSTKAFTAKLLSLLAIKAHFLNETTQFIGQLEKLTSQLNTIFSDQYQSQYLQPVVAKLLQARSSFILGRGLSYPIALEFALKIKESAYLHAEAFAAGELKHGVLALITKETPCLILAPKNEHYRAVISNAQEIKARGGYTIGISSQAHSAFDMFIPVSDTQLTTIISHTIIGQLLAYYSSIRQGLNPDKPRNLAKSVTVK